MMRTAGWITVCLLVAGCGSATDTTASGAASTSATPSSITEVHADVSFYGPCGNETLRLDGTTYYQLFQREIETLDKDAYPVPAEKMTQGMSARVPQPGKGDAVGTFVVYDDGVARFESRSGLVWWLTTEEHQYNWVC